MQLPVLCSSFVYFTLLGVNIALHPPWPHPLPSTFSSTHSVADFQVGEGGGGHISSRVLYSLARWQVEASYYRRCYRSPEALVRYCFNPSRTYHSLPLHWNYHYTCIYSYKPNYIGETCFCWGRERWECCCHQQVPQQHLSCTTAK